MYFVLIGSCLYKECLQGPWTSWEIESWTGNCPNERRFKPYREVIKYKDAYTNCRNIGPLQCPNDQSQGRAKGIN